MCTSLTRLTKSAWRNPSACPMRMPVSASNANRNRSRARVGDANTVTNCSALNVRGVRFATRSFTGRVAIGRPPDT